MSQSKRVIVKRFDSIGEFSAELGKAKTHHAERHRPQRFNGNTSLSDARKGMLTGNLSAVPAAEQMLDKLLDVPVELDTPQWEQSVAGQIPCVPAYLAGYPEAMYRKLDVQSELAPVRIFASVCVSAGLSEDELRQRGVSIMALAIRLAEIRPVELYLFADMGNHDEDTAFFPVIRVDTAPLDLCALSYCFTHPGFLRTACSTWAEMAAEQIGAHRWSGCWAWNSDPNNASARRKTAEALGATERDLVIPGGYAHDPMVKEPIKWLNDKLSKYLATVEDGEVEAA